MDICDIRRLPLKRSSAWEVVAGSAWLEDEQPILGLGIEFHLRLDHLLLARLPAPRTQRGATTRYLQPPLTERVPIFVFRTQEIAPGLKSTTLVGR